MCQNRKNWRTRQIKDISNNDNSNNYLKSVILEWFGKHLHIHYLIFFFFTKILLSSKDKHDYPQYTNEEAKAQRG